MIKNDSQGPSCTCPSGDGSLVHPCPAHPAVEQADVAAKLTFINGRPAMCGCQVEYSDGGGEYSDVIYVTLCAKHSGSAILDLVATNRIALTPEYEGQWHADLYLDREIPLAKVEGATPAEAVLALMSAERIDPEQESVEQAGGDERAAFEAWLAQAMSHHFAPEIDLAKYEDSGEYRYNPAADYWKAWQARAALAQPSPAPELAERGTQHRFSTTEQTCRHDFAGVWWNDNGVTKTGRECRHCGFFVADAPEVQAEAERPEVVAYFDRNYPSTGDAFIWSNYEGSPYEPVMTVAQHDRIVGALRADRDSWAEQAEQRLADWDEMRKERDAALAEVKALRAELQSQRERNTELIFKLGSATNGWGRCEKERDAVLAERDALATEAQALREEVTRGNRIIRAMALDLAAVGEVLGIPAEQQEGGAGEFIEAIQALQEELGRAAGQGGPSDA
ncbi:hypothetical protein N0581_27250 [Pseudomonas aeruginosa]|nr:hypothetical protein [Pseudomonas aeruginosa]MCT0160040.1 hypothetical protein [Pseudomonas aeruginosa]MCT0173909.1 hypothetical protein [Pseudomonas aeruginosa]MCT0179804.1 hypothetical protein [Pseudomonas aeruginosa]MCT0191230.1 hypothetical protein [Pseudomonas aeruginosa]